MSNIITTKTEKNIEEDCNISDLLIIAQTKADIAKQVCPQCNQSEYQDFLVYIQNANILCKEGRDKLVAIDEKFIVDYGRKNIKSNAITGNIGIDIASLIGFVVIGLVFTYMLGSLGKLQLKLYAIKIRQFFVKLLNQS